jgi:IS5 family transposase
LRELTRYRKTQVDARTREIQRLEKVLQDAGIKLSSVASGTWSNSSSRSTVEALIAGERDTTVLADLSQSRMRAKKEDVEPGDGPGQWRIAQRSAPDRVISTADPETRHVHKTQHSYRDGYKAHIAAEPDTGLITACALTAGNTGDAEAAAGLLVGEPAGTEVLGDSAYGIGELRQHLQDHEMTAVIKPPPLRPAVEGGYTLDDFALNEDAGTVTCPAGITVQITARRNARFGRHCATCPSRDRCTTAARGRVIVLNPHHGLLAAARAFAATQPGGSASASMSTWPGGARGPGGSPCGSSASGRRATWACVSMSSRPIGRQRVDHVERSLPRPSDPCCAGRRLRSHRGPNRLCRRILVTHLLDLRSGELVTS